MTIQITTNRSERYEHKKRSKHNDERNLHSKTSSRADQLGKFQKSFLGIPCKQVVFKIPSKEDREKMRLDFEMEKRAAFIKHLAKHHQKELRQAGVTQKQIEGMKKGYTPHGFNTHHKLPIYGGGTNDFSNLVLVRREPWHDMMHYHLINPQVKNLGEGDSKKITIPAPETPVFLPSPQYAFVEKWFKKGRKTYGKNKNTSLDDILTEAEDRAVLLAARKKAGIVR